MKVISLDISPCYQLIIYLISVH